VHSTKQRLIEHGLGLLLEQGYTALGLQALLAAAQVPKGSFYHHFRDKEDFALQVLDAYMVAVHAMLDSCVADQSRPPLERIRRFFTEVQHGYEQDGYLGCLLGGWGRSCRPRARSSAPRSTAVWARSRGAGNLPGGGQGRGNPRGRRRRAPDGRAPGRCWEARHSAAGSARTPPLTSMLDFYLGAVGRHAGVTQGRSGAEPTQGAPSPTASGSWRG
jgi:TetR/AcrR family transcriptional repressor of nem operon